MPAHSGPALALLVLLVLAGISKLARPAPTAGALRAAGLPHSRPVVRALGAWEVLVGLGGVVEGGPAGPAVAAVMYAGFALFVGNALRRRLPISSCGCLGAAETPPSRIHVVANVAATAVLALAAIHPLGPWGGLVGQPLSEVVPFVAFTAVTVYLLYALIAVLPLAGRRSPGTSLLPMPTRGGR